MGAPAHGGFLHQETACDHQRKCGARILASTPPTCRPGLFLGELSAEPGCLQKVQVPNNREGTGKSEAAPPGNR